MIYQHRFLTNLFYDDCVTYCVYLLFIAGRRNNLSLEYVLKFVTGMDEVPVVGYRTSVV